MELREEKSILLYLNSLESLEEEIKQKIQLNNALLSDIRKEIDLCKSNIKVVYIDGVRIPTGIYKAIKKHKKNNMFDFNIAKKYNIDTCVIKKIKK